ADHWLAVSIASAWVATSCSRSALAAVIQGRAGFAIGVVMRRLRSGARASSRSRHGCGTLDGLPAAARDRAIRGVEDLVDDQSVLERLLRGPALAEGADHVGHHRVV